jgi:tetratricopeptide (TPR) repeat protein
MDPFGRMKRAVSDAMSLAGRSATLASKRAEAALERGDFSEAEDLLKNLVAELETQPSANARCAKALLMLASAQWQQQKTSDARENAEAARRRLADTKQTSELTDCLTLLGSIALAGDDGAAAATLFEEALDTLDKTKKDDTVSYANLLRRYSEALRKKGDHTAAKSAADRALGLVERKHGKDEIQTAEYLAEVALCESALGDQTGAREILERVLEMYSEKTGPDSDEAVSTLRRLAGVCQESGDLERAVSYYEQALQIRERQLGKKSGDFGSLLVELGTVHSLLGRFGPAIETLQQAVMRLESDRDERLGSALDTLGSTYYQFGRFEDAVQCIRRAHTIWTAAPTRYERQLRANDELLVDIAGYLSEQQRAAFGLDSAPVQAAVEQPRKPKRRRSPWEVSDEPKPAASRAEPQTEPACPAAPPFVAPETPAGDLNGVSEAVLREFVERVTDAGGMRESAASSEFDLNEFIESVKAAGGMRGNAVPSGLTDSVLRDFIESVRTAGGAHGDSAPVGLGEPVLREFLNRMRPAGQRSGTSEPPPAGWVFNAPSGVPQSVDPCPGSAPVGISGDLMARTAARASMLDGQPPGKGVTVELVGPDLEPIEPAHVNGSGLHLTLVMGPNGLDATPKMPEAAQTAAPPQLNGWEDVEFEFMSLVES